MDLMWREAAKHVTSNADLDQNAVIIFVSTSEDASNGDRLVDTLRYKGIRSNEMGWTQRGQTLPEKNLYRVIDSTSSASSSSSTSTSTTDSVPGSPLMPVQEDAPEPQAARVLIPAPRDLSVPTCGWHEAQQTEYQNFARAAVHAHLDVKKSLNTQGSEARNKAIQVIKD
ncbi:hypothetical protein L218DRAFT_1001258 [Marasmius fiardii PR-910]|nr:hypothetical protein L218DRAFT_1001258 [Marasmius fiardii PR-910]